MQNQAFGTGTARTAPRSALATAALGALLVTSACTAETDRTEEAGAEVSRVAVHIAAPADGSVVDGPGVAVILEVEGLTIVPAGVEHASSGHHHLIVDAPLPDLGSPIPAEAGRYIHLGQGQTEYLLEGLPPGEHRIIALVGDHLHVPLEPTVADTIRFTVR